MLVAHEIFFSNFYNAGKKMAPLFVIRLISILSRHIPYKVEVPFLNAEKYWFAKEIPTALGKGIRTSLPEAKSYFQTCVDHINDRDATSCGVYKYRGVMFLPEDRNFPIFTVEQERFFSFLDGAFKYDIENVSKNGALWFKVGYLVSLFAILSETENVLSKTLNSLLNSIANSLESPPEDFDPVAASLLRSIPRRENILDYILALPLPFKVEIVTGEVDFLTGGFTPNSLDVIEINKIASDFSTIFDTELFNEANRALSERISSIEENCGSAPVDDAVSFFALSIFMPELSVDPDEWKDNISFTVKWMDRQTERTCSLKGGKRLFALLRFLVTYIMKDRKMTEADGTEKYLIDIHTNNKELADGIVEKIQSVIETESMNGAVREAQAYTLKRLIRDMEIKKGKQTTTTMKNWLQEKDLMLYFAVNDS